MQYTEVSPDQKNKQKTTTNRQIYTFVFLHIMQENYTLNKLTHFFPVTGSTYKTKLLAENICQSVSLLNTWFLEAGLQCVLNAPILLGGILQLAG